RLTWGMASDWPTVHHSGWEECSRPLGAHQAADRHRNSFLGRPRAHRCEANNIRRGMMAGSDYEDMTLLELLRNLAGAPQPGFPPHGRITTMIQVRLAEMQETSARELAKSTKDLVEKTAGVVSATRWLAAATFLLVLVEVVLKFIGKGAH